MARAIWTGSVAFGLVNVPVALYSATEDKTIHFNQFEAGTSDRIRYKRVNERTGDEVKLPDIVRGHKVANGDYVLITDEELEAVEPGRSRTIDIADFVDSTEIDPIYYRRGDNPGPPGEGGTNGYALLHRAEGDSGRAGVAARLDDGQEDIIGARGAGNAPRPLHKN